MYTIWIKKRKRTLIDICKSRWIRLNYLYVFGGIIVIYFYNFRLFFFFFFLRFTIFSSFCFSFIRSLLFKQLQFRFKSPSIQFPSVGCQWRLNKHSMNIKAKEVKQIWIFCSSPSRIHLKLRKTYESGLVVLHFMLLSIERNKKKRRRTNIGILFLFSFLLILLWREINTVSANSTTMKNEISTFIINCLC